MPAEIPNPYPSVERPKFEMDIKDFISDYCGYKQLEDDKINFLQGCNLEDIKVVVFSDINHESVTYSLYKKQAGTEKFERFLQFDSMYNIIKP